MDKLRLVCSCHFGLESVLKYEVNKIGGEDVAVSDGKVSFSASPEVMARANICLSTAERVLIELADFGAYEFEDLYSNVKNIPWEEFISPKDTFPVVGHSINSKLHSVPDCQSVIKKAVVDRLSSKYGITYFGETGAVHKIRFNILRDRASVCLDTSGAGLHKRGYRRESNAAPIKETLAAGIIDLARIRDNTIFYDPFCGSGTFLVEAAYKALNIAPGLRRSFAAEKWDCFSSEIWREERMRAADLIKKDGDFFACGYDIDPESTALSIANCAKAGIKNKVRIETADVKDFAPDKAGITVCNPPYGERLLELAEAEELYKVMGRVFPTDSPCYIISPHENFESLFGRKADKQRKLYNGMMQCRLFMYFRTGKN